MLQMKNMIGYSYFRVIGYLNISVDSKNEVKTDDDMIDLTL